MVALLIEDRRVPFAGEVATHLPVKNTIANNQPLSDSMVSLKSHASFVSIPLATMGIDSKLRYRLLSDENPCSRDLIHFYNGYPCAMVGSADFRRGVFNYLAD
jgi:hypothetical protein